MKLHICGHFKDFSVTSYGTNGLGAESHRQSGEVRKYREKDSQCLFLFCFFNKKNIEILSPAISFKYIQVNFNSRKLNNLNAVVQRNSSTVEPTLSLVGLLAISVSMQKIFQAFKHSGAPCMYGVFILFYSLWFWL